MPDIQLKFPSSSVDPSFRLLELPPELCGLIESSLDNNLELSIKGRHDEDAVLCTPDRTYAIRSIVLSNSVLVITPPDSRPGTDCEEDMDDTGGSPSSAVIQESLSEILELIPTVPKLHRLVPLLRGMEWEDGREDDDQELLEESIKPKRRRYTYEQAKAELQASGREIDRAIKEKHILIMDGALRPISSSYLHTILELLLTTLVSLSQSHESASVIDLTMALESDHEIHRKVTSQVMRWFGDIVVNEGEERWRVDVQSIVKEVGLSILRHYKVEPIAEEDFMQKWRNAVGDTFESEASISLLTGNYLSSLPSLSTIPSSSNGRALTYFPRSGLPVDPALRFADLFLTRPRWRSTDIAPFLEDIAVDSKDRDKLLLKYARSLTDSEGLWYTARTR